MTMDYNALALTIGLFSAIFAVVAVWLESRRSRIALQADLLLKLNERFYGPQLLKWRQTAARKLLKEEYPNHELEDLLDFFWVVAKLVQRKAIDARLAYDSFEYWIVRYWQCAEKLVEESRRYDSESWEAVEQLSNKLAAERSKMTQPPLTKEERVRFLKEEARD